MCSQQIVRERKEKKQEARDGGCLLLCKEKLRELSTAGDMKGDERLRKRSTVTGGASGKSKKVRGLDSKSKAQN